MGRSLSLASLLASLDSTAARWWGWLRARHWAARGWRAAAPAAAPPPGAATNARRTTTGAEDPHQHGASY